MSSVFRPAVVSLAILSLLCGIVYPLAITAVAQAVFPWRANGSVIELRGVARGSALVGQPFDDPRYFWGRPSATSPVAYDGAHSSGSNLGPTNPALLEAVRARLAALRAADPGNDRPVPVDLVTSSASGLDPHISPAAAEWQVPRVARARGMREDDVRAIVARFTEERDVGIFGERRVNVLAVNLALDGELP